MKDNFEIGVNEKPRLVSLSELHEGASKGKLLGNDYSAVSDVKVGLEAFVGSTNISIKELFDLEFGSIVKLKETVDSTMLLKLEGKPVAKGLLVVVGDNFGIKITDIIDTSIKVK